MKRTTVTLENFSRILEELRAATYVSFDSETTGLRPHHGSRIFGFSFAFGDASYYFDLNLREPLPAGVLSMAGALIDAIFGDAKKRIFMHNAKFDLSMLLFARDVSEIKASIHCTLTMARLEYNDHMSYSLDDCAKRIGLEKDDKVKEWLEANECFTWEEIPGKQSRRKNWHFDRVPFELISEYAMIDAEVTYALGMYQLTQFREFDAKAIKRGTPSIRQVYHNELALTKTTLSMEMLGLKIDLEYVRKAIDHQEKRICEAVKNFEYLTGHPFKASGKLFEQVFATDRPSWGFTEKGNPSFDSEHLKKFKNPAAKSVLEYRDAKAKHDFFQGLIYHADSTGFVHPNFNPFGTATGRFSSSDPNFQNLTAEEDAADPFPIRRALIPPGDDFCIVSIDYVAMEYIKLLELAARLSGEPSELLIRVRAGADVHQATADLAKEFGGVEITRKAAKMTNFLTIYGGGDKKLAEGLGITVDEARAIRAAIFKGCPDIKLLMEAVSKTAEHREYIFNWMGRISHFPDYRFCYKALNYLIQGGCADVVKKAMNACQALIDEKKLLSRLVMTVHDELVFYIHRTEFYYVQEFARLMSGAFPHTFIGMRVSIEASWESLGSLIPWDKFTGEEDHERQA